MNTKTTLVLLLLVLGGGVFFYFGNNLSISPARSKPSADQGTLDFLERQLTAENLTKIDIKRGDHHVVLTRTQGGEWSLPGQWPARKAEVDELVALLTNLRSRFVQIAEQSVPASSESPLEITVKTADGEHRISLTEEAGQTNRFARATYLRLDGKDESVRLGPGLIAALDKPQDYYQQRRLFAADRVAKENDSTEKVERLAAKAMTTKAGTTGYTLTKAGDEWDLSQPIHDHTDPDKLKTILTAVPDIWAERFMSEPKKTLADFGLDKPEQTLQVTRDNGTTVNLLVGKESQVKTRTVMRPAPSFGGPPMPPQREVIHEPYRYAKLQDNEQVFEIRADKLKDIFVAADTLRDPRIARFRSDDAKRVELERAGQTITLVKDKDNKWKVEKPWQAEGETSKILELLDKVSGLQAQDKDIIDKGDPKAYGLDKPYAKLALTIEEEKKAADSKSKQSRNLNIALGKREADKSKLYLQVAGLDRINAIDDSLQKLVDRPALAYRNRRVLDFPGSEVAKIEVRQGAQAFTLEQTKGAWRLSGPTSTDLDSIKTDQLAGDLGRLEALEFAAESAPAAELEKTYGLDKPALQATVNFSDAKKPAQTLQIGKQVPGKPEYYAKLAGSPSVFVVKKEIRDALEKDSLSYRPGQLLQLSPEAISELRITKAGPEYRIARQGTEWKIQGPFDAPVSSSAVKTITDELTNLRSERYVAHVAKDLAAYGLDKPYLRVVLREEPEKAKDAKEKPAARERTLLFGKPTDKDAKTRFAKIGDLDAVFVVNEKTIAALDHEALDLLDRNLLNLDTKTISRMRQEGIGGPLTLEHQGQEWKVLDTPSSPFQADSEAAAKAVGSWANIRATRFAAYGPKADRAPYGLDKPQSSAKVTLTPAASSKEKPTEHSLSIGKKCDATGSEYFALLDNGPGIIVLPATVIAELTHGYLDFVDRNALKLNPAAVTDLQRKSGSEILELKRKESEWRMLKPREVRADGPTLDMLVDQLSALRANKVAAYPAKDLKPYGLDAPEAVLTVRSSEGGKPSEHAIKLGKNTGAAPIQDDRYAVVDEGKTVFVLPASLASRLTSTPLQFLDKNLTRFGDADKMVLNRGARKAVFAKVDGQWKLTEPLDAPAEQTDLEEFAAAAARLRADEIVAEKPGDLKSYGLDKPTSTWRFFVGDREVLNLLVGSVEKGKAGQRHYGKIASSDLVFLMTPEFTTKALAEYRNRTVWPALDAVGIDRLSYRSAEHPFVLAKPENDWMVEGKPGLKVKGEAVRETLDALASLRAEGYVADKGGDLKLFGLEPPQLTIEIQTKSGKRILQIGRQAEGTKRYYARIPDNEVAPVFLISEADGAKIVRELSALTQH